jgi:DNA-directed RNA polymerase specialized sigma24 family protein
LIGGLAIGQVTISPVQVAAPWSGTAGLSIQGLSWFSSSGGLNEEDPVSAISSVTQWVNRLQAGDRAAVQKLWEAYFRRLVGLARGKLHGTPRKAADEEDVALSAFDSFCRGAEAGRFPRLGDRADLWQLLVVITARKAADLAAHARRKKRDFRRAQPLDGTDTDGGGEGPAFAELIAREPDPAFAAQVAEECRRLLDKLDDAELRKIALLKMEGRTNEEVGAEVDRAVVTVERRLRVIRKLWEADVVPRPAAGRGEPPA